MQIVQYLVGHYIATLSRLLRDVNLVAWVIRTDDGPIQIGADPFLTRHEIPVYPLEAGL